jgi:RNA polymerase sigma factor (sigma-70 family)
MNECHWLTEQFEENRGHLRGVAYRMLGSLSEADDAVQECWLRLSRSDTDNVENLRAWLTTVVSRICMDMLRSRQSRREEPLETAAPEPAAKPTSAANPETEALLAESVGYATLVVLGRLNPAERIAFVLHDLFDFPFEEIARITGRSPEAARQLASRARRRVRGVSTLPEDERAQQQSLVERFLAALRLGDATKLLEAAFDQMTAHAPQIAQNIKGSPLGQLYPEVNWETLLRKIAEMESHDFDLSEQVKKLRCPTMLVFADADSIRPEHVVAFYKALGGGQRDAGLDGSLRSGARLGVVPGATHCNILSTTAVAGMASPFLS